MRGNRIIGVIAVAVLLVGVLGSCSPSDQHPVIFITNGTDSTVDVALVREGDSAGSTVTSELQPGAGYSYDFIAEGCSDSMQLIALDAQGTVVARSGPPVCRPSTWVFQR